MPRLAPQGPAPSNVSITVLRRAKHQAERGAKEEEAGDLEVKAGCTGALARSLRGGSGWAGGLCSARRGSPEEGWGCCLQAACSSGCQCCCLRSPAQAQFGVDGVGMLRP